MFVSRFFPSIPVSLSPLSILGIPCIKEVMTAEMMKENRQRNGKDLKYKNKRLKRSDQKEKSFLLSRKKGKRSLMSEIIGQLDGLQESQK